MAFPTQLSTVVKNGSSQELFFPYLDGHGKTLAAGASFTEEGDLIAKWSDRRPKHRMMRNAINTDLIAGTLVILQTPRSIDQGASAVAKAAVIDGSDAFAVEALNYSA